MIDRPSMTLEKRTKPYACQSVFCLTCTLKEQVATPATGQKRSSWATVCIVLRGWAHLRTFPYG